ncbi:MAG TPA: LptF/LptG family permease [Tepidisphaeraceae bacterium]|nr:LptF/LptG family permease [Tepidisphaeraceae bacterium]
MKILDRYVLFRFLVDYAISLMVLIGMYVVLDMVFNFDELVGSKEVARLSAGDIIMNLAGYYYYQSFLIFSHLAGMITVVAAGFTLIRLSRCNELSAVLAAGIPLLRLAAPIIFAAVVLQGLLALDQEVIIPNIIHKLTRQHDQVYEDAGAKSFPIQAMQDDRNGLLFAGRYSAAQNRATMIGFDVLEFNPQLQLFAHTVADQADWDDRRQEWHLRNGRRVTGMQPSETRSPEQPVASYKSNITPDEISLFHSGEFVNLLSLSRINQLLLRPQTYGAINLLRVKHFRLSQLVINVVMLLIAIPCVMAREPGKLKSSIFRCLVLTGLCMASYFIAYQIAGSPPAGAAWANRWPAMLAAAPIILFGPVAVFLLDRIPT